MRNTTTNKQLIPTTISTMAPPFKRKPSPSTKMTTNTLPFDVLCGRGNGVNNTSGNVNFRRLIEKHRPMYIQAARRDKIEIAQLVVREIRNEGGRFLRREESRKCWIEIASEKALEKTCQALREDANLRKSEPGQSTPSPPPPTPPSQKDAPRIRGSDSAKQSGIKKVSPSTKKATPAKSSLRLTDFSPDHPATRNLILDALWKDEQARRHAAKEQRLKIHAERDSELQMAALPKQQDYVSSKLDIVPTPTSAVPKHRLMSPPKPMALKSDEINGDNENSRTEESASESTPTTTMAVVNSVTPVNIESPSNRDTIGITQPLGFHSIWFRDDEWEEMFSCLVAYKKELGHCAIPPGWSENPRLADWASYQRHVQREIVSGYRTATPLELKRLDRLNALGFVWDYDVWHWDRRFRELGQFLEEQRRGTAGVPKRAVLEHWSRDQILHHRDGVQGKYHLMRPDRLLRLQSIKFQWNADV